MKVGEWVLVTGTDRLRQEVVVQKLIQRELAVIKVPVLRKWV